MSFVFSPATENPFGPIYTYHDLGLAFEDGKYYLNPRIVLNKFDDVTTVMTNGESVQGHYIETCDKCAGRKWIHTSQGTITVQDYWHEKTDSKILGSEPVVDVEFSGGGNDLLSFPLSKVYPGGIGNYVSQQELDDLLGWNINNILKVKLVNTNRTAIPKKDLIEALQAKIGSLDKGELKQAIVHNKDTRGIKEIAPDYPCESSVLDVSCVYCGGDVNEDEHVEGDENEVFCSIECLRRTY